MYFTFQPVAQSHAVQQPPKLPPTSKGKVSTLEDLYVGNSWVTMARFDSHGAISHSNWTSTVTMVGIMDVASFFVLMLYIPLPTDTVITLKLSLIEHPEFIKINYIHQTRKRTKTRYTSYLSSLFLPHDALLSAVYAVVVCLCVCVCVCVSVCVCVCHTLVLYQNG